MTALRAVLHQDRRYWTIHLTKSSRNNISCYFETLKLSKRLYMTFDLWLEVREAYLRSTTRYTWKTFQSTSQTQTMKACFRHGIQKSIHNCTFFLAILFLEFRSCNYNFFLFYARKKKTNQNFEKKARIAKKNYKLAILRKKNQNYGIETYNCKIKDAIMFLIFYSVAETKNRIAR